MVGPKIVPYIIKDRRGVDRDSTFGERSIVPPSDDADPEEQKRFWTKLFAPGSVAGLVEMCRKVASDLTAGPDAGDKGEKGSLAWFGLMLRQQTYEVSSRVERLKLDQSMQTLVVEAFRLGSLCRAAVRRRDFEDDTIRGRELRKRASEGGHTRVSKFKPRIAQKRAHWQSRAIAAWQKNPSLSKTAVARMIARETSEKPGTIRRYISKTR